MAFHIPFNQRASAQQRPAPIYIGFAVQRPPRKKFNWWGFNGLWMSVASLATAGFLSPVPLLVSLMGLRRPGKKMATVGTFVSLAGVVLASTIVLGSVAAHNHHMDRRHDRAVKKQVVETHGLLAVAADEIIQHDETPDVSESELASQGSDDSIRRAVEANMLVIKYIDPWGESLRYDMEGDGGIVRSSGPDRQFDSRDDVTLRVGDENVKATPLLDVKSKVTTKDLMED